MSVEELPSGLSWHRVDGELRVRLERWFARRYPVDAEDLADRVVLQLVRVASRVAQTDEGLCRLAWKIARDVRCDHVATISHRPKPLTGVDLDLIAAVPRYRALDEPYCPCRDLLRQLRPHLEPRLGLRQQALLSLILDEDIVSQTKLAQRLSTDRKRVREMVRGIGKRMLRITSRGSVACAQAGSRSTDVALPRAANATC